MYKYEHELNRFLKKLNGIDSRGDAEVRDKKEVVKAVERVLEGAEHVIGEAVEKRPSLVVSPTPVTEEPLSGFDVDRGAVEEFGPASAEEQVGAPPASDDVVNFLIRAIIRSLLDHRVIALEKLGQSLWKMGTREYRQCPPRSWSIA